MPDLEEMTADELAASTDEVRAALDRLENDRTILTGRLDYHFAVWRLVHGWSYRQIAKRFCPDKHPHGGYSAARRGALAKYEEAAQKRQQGRKPA